MEYVDLHAHSTASDGTLTPAGLVQLAKQAGLSGLALTDHDTVRGVAEAAEAARQAGISFIAGIEISCIFPKPGTMHLLGYCVDASSPQLANLSEQLLAGRNERNPQIVARLNELGVEITMDEVVAEAKGKVIGRPHMAAILVRKGYVKSIQEAFDKYLGQGAPAFFDKEVLTARQAMELVLGGGGIPVLAHPTQLRLENDAQLERVVKDLLDLGLRGIEVMHSDHTPEQIEKYTRLADRYGLLKTGGSDYHGANKKHIELGVVNGQRVPRRFMDELLAESEKKLKPQMNGDSRR